jgi:uncharacterized protein (DUF302 family)
MSASTHPYAAIRVERVWDLPYELYVRRLESLLGAMDPDVLAGLVTLDAGQATRVLTRFVGPSGFAIFQKLDHGALLTAFTGRPTRATTYVFGNALIAIEMTKHVSEVGLYVPLRMFVEEIGPQRVRVTYDLPSATLGQFASPAVNAVAADLDRKVDALVSRASTPT